MKLTALPRNCRLDAYRILFLEAKLRAFLFSMLSFVSSTTQYASYSLSSIYSCSIVFCFFLVVRAFVCYQRSTALGIESSQPP